MHTGVDLVGICVGDPILPFLREKADTHIQRTGMLLEPKTVPCKTREATFNVAQSDNSLSVLSYICSYSVNLLRRGPMMCLIVIPLIERALPYAFKVS